MIEFQIGGRKSGKTTLLLEWLKDAPPGERRIMVCTSNDSADNTYHRALELGMNVRRDQFVSFRSFSNGSMRGMKNAKLGIDNLDCMLPLFFDGYEVERVTATGADILHDV